MKPRNLIKLKYCLRCRQCCQFKKGDEDWSPLFDNDEVKEIDKLKIKAGWRKSGVAWRTKLVSSGKNKKLLLCPFFDQTRSLCRIERQKPLDCLIWPFVFMKNKKETAINLNYYGQKYCPGLKEIGKKEFNRYKKYLSQICQKINKQKISDISWDFDPEAIFVKELVRL